MKNYLAQQLLDLIQYGFPLDFDRSCKVGQTLENHTSTLAYGSHGTEYIELQFGAMFGAFSRSLVLYIFHLL